MKSSKLLPLIVVPFLLFATSMIAYLAISNAWSLDISTYVIFVFTAFYILIFEQIIPLKTSWKIKKENLWSDTKHFLFSITIFDALGKTASLSLVLYLQSTLFKPLETWDTLPFIITFIIANIIGEFLPYLYHKISHVGNVNSVTSLFLWKTHAIHHLPTSLNWMKTNWIHPINMFLNTVLKMMPLLLLGFSKEIIFSVGIMHIVIAYISHANIKTKTGFLDYLIVTPQLHHFHHSELLDEAKNFGNIIPFWDLIFGTYYNRKGGVDKVGVIEGELSYPDKKRYWAQLIFPFRS